MFGSRLANGKDSKSLAFAFDSRSSLSLECGNGKHVLCNPCKCSALSGTNFGPCGGCWGLCLLSSARSILVCDICRCKGLSRAQETAGERSGVAQGAPFDAGAAPRYLFTHLTSSALCVFHPADGPLLTYLEEDGKQIEPDYFVPAVPMILLNGASGIGTGFSTYVPNYALGDVIANIRAMLRSSEPVSMSPAWAGFGGTVTAVGNGDYLVCGSFERVGDARVRITELPIGTSIDAYKSFLEGDKLGVRSLKNNCTDRVVDFTVEFSPEKLAAMLPDLGKELGLTKKISTGNMHLFDSKGHIRKYESVTAILRDFFEVRAAMYERRLQHLVRAKEEELTACAHRAHFITGVLAGTIRLLKAKASEVRADMTAASIPEAFHQRFLSLSLSSLCADEVDKLLAAKECLAVALNDIRRKDGAQLWEEDLLELEKSYELRGRANLDS
jgi:DNA topoisomerase-2